MDQMDFGKKPGRVAAKESAMADWLIKKGFAKTPEVAQGIMLGIVVVNIIIIYLIVRYFVY